MPGLEAPSYLALSGASLLGRSSPDGAAVLVALGIFGIAGLWVYRRWRR